MKGTSSTTYILGLPPISDLDDLAAHLRLSPGLLHRLFTRPDLFYKKIRVKKRSGDDRIVYGPAKPLKAVQRWIAQNILSVVTPHPAATAYIKDKSIANNVMPHEGRRYSLCLDVANFFDSIEAYRVYSIFGALGYSRNVSGFLTELCTLDGRLPQGAATSPVISNIVAIRLDRRIAGYAGPRHMVYTRYADDITLSGNNPEVLYKSFRMVAEILAAEGFRVNRSKTRRMGPRQRRLVTGLVISQDGSVGIGTRQKRRLRACIHRLLTANLSHTDRVKLEQHINGWLGHVRSVDTPAYDYLVGYRDRLLAKASE